MQCNPIKYKVSIQCFTYNQSKYITDALTGFVKQKTDFPFIILLVDDASTDGEQDVIKKYVSENFEIDNHEIAYNKETEFANITYAQHNINRNCYIVVHYLKFNHYRKKSKLPYLAEWRDPAKYEAICEGDDYWTDPLKLQKQVEFLEANPDYTMCFHNAIEHYEGSEVADRPFSKVKDNDYYGRYLFKNWIVPTASVLYRVSVVKSDLYMKVLNCKDFIYGDTPLFVTCAELGKVRGMSDVMSVYRRNSGGVTQRTKEAGDLRFHRHQDCFYKIFGKDYYSPILICSYYLISIVKSALRKDFKTLRNVWLNNPYKKYSIIAFFYLPIAYIINMVNK